MAIRNFRHRGLERLFVHDTPRGVSPAMAPKIKRMLFALAHASEVADMAVFPGWRLHPLRGDRREDGTPPPHAAGLRSGPCPRESCGHSRPAVRTRVVTETMTTWGCDMARARHRSLHGAGLRL